MAQQSNTEFLTEVMDFSRTGPVMQLFILDTLNKHAKVIADMPPAELQKAFGENSFINSADWQAAAKEFLQAFKEHSRG